MSEQIWLQIAPLMPHSSYKYSQYTACKSTNIWQNPGNTWHDTPCCHWILSINSMSPAVYKIIATGSLSTLDLLRTVGTNIKHISITLNLFQGWWLKRSKMEKTKTTYSPHLDLKVLNPMVNSKNKNPSCTHLFSFFHVLKLQMLNMAYEAEIRVTCGPFVQFNQMVGQAYSLYTWW